MSSEKFTPGPWEFEKQECNLGECRRMLCLIKTAKPVGSDGKPLGICLVEATNPKYFDMIERNFNLIAAAPEMYAELKDLVPILRGTGMEATANCIEALLMKARGEE